jgi:hypothetical protein
MNEDEKKYFCALFALQQQFQHAAAFLNILSTSNDLPSVSCVRPDVAPPMHSWLQDDDLCAKLTRMTCAEILTLCDQLNMNPNSRLQRSKFNITNAER